MCELGHEALRLGGGGIIWWEWDTTKGGDDDHGYTPRGKPAEKILREWFAGKREAGAPGTARTELVGAGGRTTDAGG